MSRSASASMVVAGIFLVILIGIVTLGVRRYNQPLPPAQFEAAALPTAIPGQPPALPWPQMGAAAVAVDGIGILGSHADAKPRSLASVTKMMTALVVLEDHPIRRGEKGPMVPVTAADVENYRRELADGQSVVPVAAGSQMTEYQLIQGVLIPSGNNLAEMAAVWDAGSVDAFVAKMNARAAALGMKGTHYADASGNHAASIGLASDQVLLAQAALRNDTFAEIVAQPQAELPVAGVVYNVNALIGKGGNIGVKTGSSDEAGSCFVFAVQQTIAGQPMRVIGAVLGLQYLENAFKASQDLAAAAPSFVQPTQVIASGTPVGYLTTEWGERVPVATTEAASFPAWPGLAVQSKMEPSVPAVGSASGAAAGTLTIGVGDKTQKITVQTQQPLTEPGLRWRLFR